MSSASERRVWWGRAKVAAVALVALAVVAGGVYLIPKIEGGPELLTKAGESMPVAHIEVQTSGNLQRDFILKRLAVPVDANLLSVDLDELKGRLESVGQVQSVVVERRFPDALVISIVERKPIVRILAQRSNGEKLILFVDKEGEVFESEAFDVKVSRTLPFLDGVSLTREDEGFSRIEDIGPLANLLSEAQAIAPHLYSRWRVVSLERSDRLIAKGPVAKEIVFDRNADFREQLGKLDYVLDYYRSATGKPFKRVDLTLGDQVPVTL